MISMKHVIIVDFPVWNLKGMLDVDDDNLLFVYILVDCLVILCPEIVFCLCSVHKRKCQL